MHYRADKKLCHRRAVINGIFTAIFTALSFSAIVAWWVGMMPILFAIAFGLWTFRALLQATYVIEVEPTHLRYPGDRSISLSAIGAVTYEPSLNLLTIRDTNDKLVTRVNYLSVPNTLSLARTLSSRVKQWKR